LLIGGCSNQRVKSNKNESESQLAKQFNGSISKDAQEGKLTSNEKRIVKAHDNAEAQKLATNQVHFEKNTVVTQKGTVKIEKLAILPIYTTDNKLTSDKSLLVGLSVKNNTNKPISTDSILTNDLSITPFQNDNGSETDLSRVNTGLNIGDLASDTNNEINKGIEISNEYDSKILPHKTVYRILDGFQLKNEKEPITFKLTTGGITA
ncbi:DUF5067 domain-containing protein, partial [Lactococcus lactis]|uniref:DUF5067 domain-containing protein n=1 Tax=Lactococcus lactis TaxID=1358 RepID=UPI0015DB0C06